MWKLIVFAVRKACVAIYDQRMFLSLLLIIIFLAARPLSFTLGDCQNGQIDSYFVMNHTFIHSDLACIRQKQEGELEAKRAYYDQEIKKQKVAIAGEAFKITLPIAIEKSSEKYGPEFVARLIMFLSTQDDAQKKELLKYVNTNDRAHSEIGQKPNE